MLSITFKNKAGRAGLSIMSCKKSVCLVVQILQYKTKLGNRYKLENQIFFSGVGNRQRWIFIHQIDITMLKLSSVIVLVTRQPKQLYKVTYVRVVLEVLLFFFGEQNIIYAFKNSEV